MYNRFYLAFIASIILALSLIPGVASAAPVPYLDQLSVKEAAISPTFRPTTLFYSVSVSEEVASLTIDALPQESDTKIAITGNADLQPGANTIRVTLTSSSQQTQTYTLTVNKAGGAVAEPNVTQTETPPSDETTTTAAQEETATTSEAATVTVATPKPSSGPSALLIAGIATTALAAVVLAVVLFRRRAKGAGCARP